MTSNPSTKQYKNLETYCLDECNNPKKKKMPPKTKNKKLVLIESNSRSTAENKSNNKTSLTDVPTEIFISSITSFSSSERLAFLYPFLKLLNFWVTVDAIPIHIMEISIRKKFNILN